LPIRTDRDAAELRRLARRERDGRVSARLLALVLPEVSTAAMDVFLTELAAAVPTGTRAVLALGRAGWHLSGDLRVPANLALATCHLPP
jgi:hypothetical protein